MNSEFNKITIVTPSFNQGAYIEETILSVLNQNYPNLEYIIIDGGSTDDTLDVIHRYKDKLTFHVSEEDNGQSDALNKGFKKSTGTIALWLNSDDCLTPNALYKINDFFRAHKEIDFCHGKSILYGKDLREKIVGDHSLTKQLQLKYISCIPFPQPSSFFRSSVLVDNSFQEDLHYGMDYHFYLSAVLKGKKGMYVNDLFSRYRLHSKSKSNHDLLFANDWAKVFSKFLLSIPSTDKYVEIMKRAELFVDSKERFSVTIQFSELEIQQITLEHILVQVHTHYSALATERAIILTRLIQEISPFFYSEKKLYLIKLKCFLPKGMIKALRKLTR